MKHIFVLFLITPILFATTLLNHNIYEREKRVDLMLSFDSPFDGSVRKTEAADNTLNIRLTGVGIMKPFSKELQNGFVRAITITGSGNNTVLVKIYPTKERLNVEASKTIDGFGLRLRIQPAAASKKPETDTASRIQQSASLPLNTLESSNSLPGWRYWSVLLVMLLLLLVLWFVKRRRPGVSIGANWLMPKIMDTKTNIQEANIRYQKRLDSENRLMLLEFNDKQYLIVVGKSGILLDTFSEKKVEDPDSFTSVFEANKKQLDHFLKENHPDAYEAFKTNASRDEHL